MKRLSAQYIITNSGPFLKRGIITAGDDGTIISVEDTGGDLKETHSTEFYNGIIIPGFVNCHSHLELSHLKGVISEGKGLGRFIEEIRSSRDKKDENPSSSAIAADQSMYDAGIVLCADVCNTSDSFAIKKKSRIRYINLLEVFGLDPDKAVKRINEIMCVAETARQLDLPFWLVPHSVYSMSLTLLRLLRNESLHNKVTSIHFMETAAEETFLKNRTGPLMESYIKSQLLPSRLETAGSHSAAVLNELTMSGNLILVHSTFTDRNTVRLVKKRKDLYWCLCPNSNLYIEKIVPPVNLLLEEDCEIVLGTDSLASNSGLSILEELKTLSYSFPEIPLKELISWATINGAKALGENDLFGSIEPGKKPGLLLLQNVDMQNMRLLPGSFVTRLA